MGDSPLGIISRQLTEETSKPHGHKNGLFVCRCMRCFCSLIPKVYIFFMCCFFQYTFQVTSQPLPNSNSTATTALPASPIINSTNTSVGSTKTHRYLLFDTKIAVGIGVSTVFVVVILVMGFLKYLRFKIKRKRVAERVAAVVSQMEGDDRDEKENRSVKSVTMAGVDAASVMRFSWEEMERLSYNFSMVIGSGGFSTVYLAHFPDSTLGAIKIQSSSERLNRVYKQELEILLHLRHDNIVKLLGYCNDREEGVLVFEYVPSGSLQEKLHGSNICRDGRETGKKTSILPWKNRMNIAFQVAQSIEYLHEKCTLQIVHGDIKASNILLDEQLNCKLCDFGSAKMGFSSTVLPQSSPRIDRTMLGSLGYADPHYLRTGIASKKNDLYSFGVVVLELITGIEAFNATNGERLTSTAGPILGDAMKVADMVDRRLGGDFDMEEAMVMASISALCLSDSPSLRPSASEILQIMREKIPSISVIAMNEFQKSVPAQK